jgi:hypothetical protein
VTLLFGRTLFHTSDMDGSEGFLHGLGDSFFQGWHILVGWYFYDGVAKSGTWVDTFTGCILQKGRETILQDNHGFQFS